MKRPAIPIPAFLQHIPFAVKAHPFRKNPAPPELPPRRKIPLLLLTTILLACGIAAAFFLRDYFAAVRVPGETRVNQGIINSVNGESYRFTLTSQLTVHGQERPFNTICGEKSKQDYHIRGNILGTEVNLYQMGDTSYRQDPIDHKWTVMEKTNLEKESLLLSELNPIANFYFNEIGNITSLENEANEKQWGMKYAITPDLANHWLEAYFTRLDYTIWVTKQAPYYLKRAVITAVSKSDPTNTLTMEIIFSDFNAPITITRPVLK